MSDISVASDFSESINVIASLNFWLQMPEDVLRVVLRKSNFALITPADKLELPGVVVSVSRGPKKLIARYRRVKIFYDVVKNSLSFEGELNSVADALSKIKEPFLEFGYSLKDIIHYCEVILPAYRVQLKEFLDILRNKVNFEITLNNNTVLKPYTISSSNREYPISDAFLDWYHISVSPDVNSTEGFVVISMIRRLKTYEDALNFTSRIEEELVDFIKKFK